MKKPASPPRLLYGIIAFLSLIGIVIVVRRMLTSIPVLINGYHPPVVKSNFTQIDDSLAQYPLLILVHIIPGLIFVLVGPFQFIQKIRTRYPRWHRFSGRLFLICGVVIGVTALIMSFAVPAIGGVNQAAATVLFSVFFLYALFKIFQQVRQHKLPQHREWAIRVYAVGMAITTIRIINGIFFATSRFTGLTPKEFFGIGFWIGFVLHLIAAEYWIGRTRLVKTKSTINALTNDPFIKFMHQ
ncbi:Predicted membrane protein [Mucilaginibacter lappiensis]|uniref:Membrane protein n=1 Tax=Mucilaginibacter lappiensis TaxID=354630 RepID=A0ABR6PTE2_9SPHI|nr:DUF2306 domain-containing protein [Mucilaginibacter lappiensis]MBB6112409.1 putative membrane protein [Mucilaginibacter lappiensis]SIS00791.1 Predicted membrane protein [Mucilaginibacter lappiensis]